MGSLSALTSLSRILHGGYTITGYAKAATLGNQPVNNTEK
jgi:hypothetical protein